MLSKYINIIQVTTETEIGFHKGSRIIVDKYGQLKSLKSPDSSYYENVDQEFGWYSGHPGQNLWPTDRASGAYIFRPATQNPQYFNNHGSYAQVYQGSIVQEVHQYLQPGWVSQVIRTYAGLDGTDVEFEWLIGPIPISDGIGKEVITAYTCPGLDSKNTFYTDANGRQMMKRVKDYRPTWSLNTTEPVSENYYPVDVESSGSLK